MATTMPEITLGDLLTWEPRLQLVSLNGKAAPSRASHNGVDSLVDRGLSWAVTVRATPPMLPTIRGDELVIVPSRVVSESGISLGILLLELAGRGVAGVVVDQPVTPPDSLPVLIADPFTPDLESDINRLLTEQIGRAHV